MKIDGKPSAQGEQLTQTEESPPEPKAEPRGNRAREVKIPDGRDRSGKKDGTAEASPRTAISGPAMITAGATGGLTRTGGGRRAGGIRLGGGEPASRTPGAHAVARKATSKAATSDREAVQEVLPAED